MEPLEEITLEKKTFGEKLASYLDRKLEDKDVTFIVGPTKEKIKGFRIGMKASSPEIEKLFDEKWDVGIVNNEGEGGIPLPSLDPNAFHVFLKLLFSDEYSTEEIESMNLSTETQFNLIRIAREFKIEELELAVIPLVQHVFTNFAKFVESQEALQISQVNLEAILTDDDIDLEEVEIFKFAKSWAEAQCSTKDLVLSGTNIREELGRALFQIRLPLMSATEFADVVCPTRILTEMEEFRILKYIAQSNKHDLSSTLAFNTKRRGQSLFCDDTLDGTLVHPFRRSLNFKSFKDSRLNLQNKENTAKSELDLESFKICVNFKAERMKDFILEAYFPQSNYIDPFQAFNRLRLEECLKKVNIFNIQVTLSKIQSTGDISRETEYKVMGEVDKKFKMDEKQEFVLFSKEPMQTAHGSQSNDVLCNGEKYKINLVIEPTS